jgi:Arc/MetJ-type ribon-helix-helix transcriptional regulator
MNKDTSMGKHVLVELPVQMHRDLRLLSVYEEKSMSAIVRDALKQVLDEAKRQKRMPL